MRQPTPTHLLCAMGILRARGFRWCVRHSPCGKARCVAVSEGVQVWILKYLISGGSTVSVVANRCCQKRLSQDRRSCRFVPGPH